MQADDVEEDVDTSESDDSSDSDDELMAWMRRVRQTGEVQPKQVLLEQGVITDRDQLDYIDDATAWEILRQSLRMIGRHLKDRPSPLPRQRLQNLSTVADAARLIQCSSKIMILTGAGISVSCGIPDFRSANGIYKLIESRFQLPDPQALFDIRYFINNPQPFFQFAKELYPGKFQPSPSHKFIRMVEEQGKLLRNYTQNIDTLEQAAGIQKCLECHGSFRTASCCCCKTRVTCDDIREQVLREEVPRCTSCDGAFNVVKPDIVFFGEGLPPAFGQQLLLDLDEVDLLIVMGSSLRVKPVCTIPSRVQPHVPQILINRERVGQPHQFDIELLGNCDEIVLTLARHMGWAIPDAPELSGTEPTCVAPNTWLFSGAIAPPASTPTSEVTGGGNAEDGR